MKNLVIAVLGLVLVLIFVFFFSKYKSKNDLTIPNQVSVGSPKPSIITKATSNEATQTPMNQTPFTILSKEEIAKKKATIKTSDGDIVFEFYSDAPIAASNFIALANKGFYDGLIFHRVIKGFMIQGGDPKGNGTGGPGYSFKDELDATTISYQKGYVRGVVAMANAGPNTNGSQFFIVHQDYQLPHSYTIFGHAISGLDVIDKIANSQVDQSDKPLQPVTIEKVTVE